MIGLEFLMGNSENIKRQNDILGGIYAKTENKHSKSYGNKNYLIVFLLLSIVTDINMPKTDGIKMLKAIKEDEYLINIPIIVFTTSANTADIQYINKLDVEIIVKPTDWDSYDHIAKKN